MRVKLLTITLIACFLACSCGKDDVKDISNTTVEDVSQSNQESNNVSEFDNEQMIKVSGIEVDTSALKKEYIRGEIFDEANIIVSAVNEDGEAIQLAKSEYDITPVDMSTCGTKEVIVRHKDFSKTFTIAVNYNVIEVKPITKYTTSKLNLREGPGMEFNSLKAIAAGTKVDVIGVADNNWVKVSYQKKEYYCSDEYLTDDAPAVEEKLNFVGDTIIVKEDNAKQEVVDKAVKLWEGTPSKARKVLKDNLWEIYVSGTDLMTRFNYDTKISGVTTAQLSSGGEFKYDSGSIYLANNVDELSRIFYYEIGHAIDYTNGLISQQSEFQAIYKDEKDNLDITSPVNTKYKTSETEYFALLVKEIIEGNSDIAEQVPNSYAFVSKYIK